MRYFFLTLVGLLASCRTQAPAPVVASPVVQQEGRAPLHVEWLVGEQSADGARLSLSITKLLPTEKDVSVELVVPSGVAIEPALTRWVIAAAQTGTIATEVRVRWSEAPLKDLVAIVDMQGVASGFHAEVPYRFGRPAPVVQAPNKDTAPVRIGEANLGSPVDLTKK